MITAQDMDAVPINGPWQLPARWEWIQLQNLVRLDTRTINPSDTPETVFSYLGLENVEKGQWDTASYQRRTGKEIKSSCIVFGTEHILYAKLRPNLNKVVVPTQPGIGSTEWLPLYPDSAKVNREYLAWYFRNPAFVSHMVNNVSGSRMPRVQMSTFWASLVPIPFPQDPSLSLDIQCRIVDRIESLFADLREAQNTLESIGQDIDQIMSSASLEVFQDITRKVKSVSLDILTEKIGSGSTPRGANYEEDGIPFIRSLNVLWNKFSDKDIKFISPTVHSRMSATEVRVGDVLLNITGASIGRSCCPPKEILPANVNQHVAIIRPKQNLEDIYPEQKLESRFLMYWLTSPNTQRMINSLQSGATRQALTKAQIARFATPLPDPNVQKQIIAYLDSTQESVDSLQEMLQEDKEILQQVEQSILERAFRGEL